MPCATFLIKFFSLLNYFLLYDELCSFNWLIQVEQVWKHCRNEMIERNYDIEEFDLHLLDEMGEKRSKFLPPHVKQHFLDCISNRNFPIPVSEQEGYLLKKHYESFFGLSDGHRYLLSESQHNQTPPSPDSVPSSGSSPKPKSHVAAQATLTPPTPGLPYDDFLLTPPFSPPPPPHDDKQQKSIIIAVVASVIIILIGLLLCCREVKKSKISEKDDRPLLILSSSDFSGGMFMFGFL
jgi:hypothetical protein